MFPARYVPFHDRRHGLCVSLSFLVGTDSVTSLKCVFHHVRNIQEPVRVTVCIVHASGCRIGRVHCIVHHVENRGVGVGVLKTIVC